MIYLQDSVKEEPGEEEGRNGSDRLHGGPCEGPCSRNSIQKKIQTDHIRVRKRPTGTHEARKEGREERKNSSFFKIRRRQYTIKNYNVNKRNRISIVIRKHL